MRTKKQIVNPSTENMRFSLFNLPSRKFLFFSTFVILSVFFAWSSLSANEHVNYISFFLEDPPSRRKPANVTTASEKELLSKGYTPVGKIEVVYDIKKCNGDNCTQYSHNEDSATRLLKEAAARGGDLVVLTSENRISEEEDIIQGECLNWEDQTRKVEVPVYQLETEGSTTYRKLLHYEDKTEERNVCTEYELWTELKLYTYSNGTVWRKGYKSGAKKKAKKLKSQIDRVGSLARVRLKSDSSSSYKTAYIDRSGKYVIEPRFSDADDFCKGLAPVQIEDEGKWGYIDKDGKVVIDFLFETAEPFRGGLALVKLGGSFGYITADGIFKITPKYEKASSFSEGLAAVKVNREYGYIDESGGMVIRPAFSSAERFSEGLARIGNNGKYGFIDKSGALIVGPVLGDAKSFSEGLAPVRIDYKYGFIDKSGTFVIEPKFEYAQPFSEGLAAVQIERRYGFIDRSGKLVIPNDLISVEPFSDGLAKAASLVEQKTGYIDKKGTFVFHFPDCEISDLGNFAAGLATVRLENNKYFIIDSKGNRVGDIEADAVYEFDELF